MMSAAGRRFTYAVCAVVGLAQPLAAQGVQAPPLTVHSIWGSREYESDLVDIAWMKDGKAYDHRRRRLGQYRSVLGRCAHRDEAAAGARLRPNRARGREADRDRGVSLFERWREAPHLHEFG